MEDIKEMLNKYSLYYPDGIADPILDAVLETGLNELPNPGV